MQGGTPAILKISDQAEEIRGGAVMTWWNGGGAARVLAHDGNAILLERALGDRSLLAMAEAGGDSDDEATRIVCSVLRRLHAPRPTSPPPLHPLTAFFDSVFTQARRHKEALDGALPILEDLLGKPQDEVVLHGDAHHSNILDFGDGGWLAIDPKDRIGERAFDYGQVLCNPDLSTATSPERLRRQTEIVLRETGFERTHLLRWTVASAALTAAWTLEDDDLENARPQITTLNIALDLLRETDY
jgi:streptomycin 6-kinase